MRCWWKRGGRMLASIDPDHRIECASIGPLLVLEHFDEHVQPQGRPDVRAQPRKILPSGGLPERIVMFWES